MMKKILAVDNDMFILEFMQDLLSKEGYEVVCAEDGLSALDVLNSYSPDVIFTDLVMPNIDGKKLCRIVRDMERFGHVHIVVLSSILAEEGVDVEEWGVSAYISKGSFHEMKQHILSVMEQLEVEGPRGLSEEVIGLERGRPRVITEELLSRTRHLEIILESMSEGILEVTSEGRIVYANKAALLLFHLPEEKLLGAPVVGFFSENDWPRVGGLLEKLDKKPRVLGEEFSVGLNEYQVTLNVIPVSANGPTAIVIVKDVTERKRAAKMLRSERDKLQGVLNAIGEGVFIVNRDFMIEYQNEVVSNRFGEGKGKKCYKTYMTTNEPCDFCRIDKTVSSGMIQRIETMHDDGRNYDISFSPFEDVDGDVKVIVLQRDTTESKRLEAETMRWAHLASLGELSAGVAHEINNPITGIINYAEIMKDRCKEEGTDPEIPDRIIKEGLRIAHIVRNLLSFARSRKENPVPAHVKDIFSAVLDLMQKDIVEDGITLSLEIPEELPLVNVRSEEIQQVFLNIVSNARYALNQRFTGYQREKTLEIRGRAVAIEGVSYVRMVFRDGGNGMPTGILHKICNPFFTTKPRGEGAGLGLSISHGIIKRHGGRLWFKSVEGEYTEAVVDLPDVSHV
jgi:PAS domain S-box-containing protein